MKLFRHATLRTVTALLVVVLAAACGPAKVRGEAPFVTISSMSLQSGVFSVGFDIRNINDVPLEIDSAEFALRVRDSDLARNNLNLAMVIDANTTETISFDKQPGSFSAELLQSLESGEVQSLPFSLMGRIHSPEEGYLKFENEGHLYKVPGRPGQFRSASSSLREAR